MIYPAAQLLIGSQSRIIQEAEFCVQKAFCPSLCNTCITCIGIQQKKHYAVRWIRPEKQWYTLDDLEDVTHITSFALDKDEHFFFVMESVDKLSPSCANSLLKIIEEPPVGYSFLLLATRQDLVMPTIVSRCLVRVMEEARKEKELSLWCSLFTTKMAASPKEFDKAYENENIADSDVLEILDTVLSYWTTQYQKADDHRKKQAKTMLKELQYAYEHLPMPGSNKLFWRRLFITMLKGR